MLRSFLMTYSDFLKAQFPNLWLLSDRNQSNWYKQGASSSWLGTVRKTTGDYDVEGVDGLGWVMGTFGTYHAGNSTGNDGPRATSFLIKVDPAIATGVFNILHYMGSNLFLNYDSVTDTFSSPYIKATPKSAVAGIADGNWHHIAVGATRQVYNSSTYGYDHIIGLFVDGVLLIDNFGLATNSGNDNTIKRWGVPYETTPVAGIYMDELAVLPDTTWWTQEQVDAQVSALQANLTPPTLFNATPATADATMLDATFSFVPASPNVTYNAVVATATAAPVDPAVSTTANVSFDAAAAGATGAMGNTTYRATKNLRMLAPGAYYMNGTNYLSDLIGTRNIYGTFIGEAAIAVPKVGDPGLTETSKTLVLNKPTGYSGTLKVYRATKNGTSFTRGALLFSQVAGAADRLDRTYNIPVGTDAEYLSIHVDYAGSYNDGYGNRQDMAVDNPALDSEGFTGSYFMVAVAEKLIAEPATGTGEMLFATAGVTAGAIINAPAASASSEMLNGVFPDANTNADLMTATAVMGAAWFRSARRVAVGAAEATAEALTIESVVTYRNVIVEAGVAEMNNAWINNPLEVNEDINDPYWNRVTRRSTDGALPPIDQPFNWFRFNERAGAGVRRYDRITGLPLTGNSSTAPIEGSFSWGAPGPNGRRAVRIENAGINDQRDDAWTTGGQAGDLNLTQGASLEFTVKVAPGHTGRMDIANGTMTPWYSPGTHATSHISIRDGHLYAMTGKGPGALVVKPENINGKGGTSLRRIDDGKWHHIVITPRPGDYWKHDSGVGIPLDFYIDGVLDRSFLTKENQSATHQTGDPRFFARPDYYFGQETGYPFKGEILEVIFRWSSMNSSQVMDLYLDMFGYKAARAGVVGAAVGAMGDAKVESNMKRMLVLSFGSVPGLGQMLESKNNIFGVVVDEERRQTLTHMFLHGQDGKYGIGNYLMSYQQVEYGRVGDPASEMRRDRGDEPYTAYSYQFRDEKTGMQRFIDIHRDVDLDNFDVIFVQGYTNPALNSQYERDLYEPFFESLNKALVNGKKLWVTDPYLAYDLGWVSAVDEVNVLRSGNDVRGYDVNPRGTGLARRPEDGSMPVLPKALPQGSGRGLMPIWGWDMHHNNGYRVVNEIDGLTNLPTWEVEELFIRERVTMLPDGSEWDQRGYRLVNLSGEDFTWTRSDDRTAKTYDMSKPALGTGLRAGDEFYDYTTFDNGVDVFKYDSSASYMKARRGRLYRAMRTWAIPAGHLRIGTPVATFRSTHHDDFGNEVANPYRDHIRTAVVRPGDRLPDGRKVMGYAVMEFAQRPDFQSLTGEGVKKQLHFPVEYFDDLNAVLPDRSDEEKKFDETPKSVTWDWHTWPGRWAYGGDSGSITSTKYTLSYGSGATAAPTFTAISSTLPIAESRREAHPVSLVPHQNWISRGLSWLFTLDRVEAEYSNYGATAAKATGSMPSPQIDTEYDNTVTVGAAKASATIVAPAEAQVKDVKVFAAPATATGMINGLAGGYKAEAAQVFATMPQNVLRPLDIEEVLFFTVTMNQKTINLRMEEN